MSQYDRSIKMYDEPHSPEALDATIGNGELHRSKFLSFAHHDSYYRQLLEVSNLGVESVLEIGPGENFVANYFRERGERWPRKIGQRYKWNPSLI